MSGKSKRSARPGKSGSDTDLASGLYVTATPIGNAADITLRALEVLAGCDLIAAEDTRVSAKLLAIHGISKPLTAYNDHNAAQMRPKLLARLKSGERIAISISPEVLANSSFPRPVLQFDAKKRIWSTIVTFGSPANWSG